ncbi:hypothetical protein PVK06_021059 [Gossypium arboreum]|uniref:Uncharacterized protein n=1 Tax=Gossypium arboreum TaxID=29729 RepID=A0ABR0PNY1_GOSAR|nr:hypothetical protein PVK06_021059 [Gossypium arboreum]
MGQLTHLLAGEFEKRSGPVVNSEDDVEKIIYSPGFAPISVSTQPDMQEAPVVIGHQHQTNTSALSPDINNVSDAVTNSESLFGARYVSRGISGP